MKEEKKEEEEKMTRQIHTLELEKNEKVLELKWFDKVLRQ